MKINVAGCKRPRYSIDLLEAIESIRFLNRSITFVARDYLLNRYFGDLDWFDCKESVFLNVVLIDGLYATNLRNDPGAAEIIAKSLANNAKNIGKILSKLAVDDLRSNPKNISEAAKKLFPSILQPKGNNIKEHFVFATKFFHWCARNQFPIYDSRSSKRADGIQENSSSVPEGMSVGDKELEEEEWLDFYEVWIWFYDDLLRSLTKAQSEKLLKADFDSQNNIYRIENSLLRVLDKVLYHQGGGTGLGRTA